MVTDTRISVNGTGQRSSPGQALAAMQAPKALAVAGGMDMSTLGRTLAASGYFKDVRDEAQAIVKVLCGAELGISPVRAMLSIHIIEGKPTLSARLMAGLVKASGKYNYRLREHTAEACSIEFFERGESIGLATFTMKDAAAAKLAGKDNWQKYPEQMLFARAMSKGFNLYTPDLSGGMPVYTPEEMGATVNAETGEPVREAPVSAAAELVSTDTLKQIVAVATAAAMSTADVTAEVEDRYGCKVRAMTVEQGAEFLAWLRGLPSEDAESKLAVPYETDDLPPMVVTPASADQVRGVIMAARRDLGLSTEAVMGLSRERYGNEPVKLTADEISDFLDYINEARLVKQGDAGERADGLPL